MSSRQKQFGAHLRSMRQLKGLGLRELARIARISPGFLSKVEAGSGPPPGEKKLRALAMVLGIDEDELIALSGRIPAELMRIISAHPREYLALLRATNGFPIEKLRHVQNFAAWASTASQARLSAILHFAALGASGRRKTHSGGALKGSEDPEFSLSSAHSKESH